MFNSDLLMRPENKLTRQRLRQRVDSVRPRTRTRNFGEAEAKTRRPGSRENA